LYSRCDKGLVIMNDIMMNDDRGGAEHMQTCTDPRLQSISAIQVFDIGVYSACDDECYHSRQCAGTCQESAGLPWTRSRF
jgi:hypothetical protein